MQFSHGCDRLHFNLQSVSITGPMLWHIPEAEFKDDEFNQAAHEVLTNPKYVGKTVLIAWHHGKIPELAKALGAKDVPDKWDPNVFDRVWEITYDAGVATWKDLPQNALPGDSQK